VRSDHNLVASSSSNPSIKTLVKPLLSAKTPTAIDLGFSLSYHGSMRRNLYAYKIPSSGVGDNDFDFMMTMYRQSGSMPEGPWKEVKKRYNDKPTHTSKHPLLKASGISS